MGASRRSVLQGAVAGLGVSGLGASSAQGQGRLTVETGSDTILVKDAAGKSLARYIFGKMPAGEKAPGVPFTDFTHPVWTPAGEVVTDVGAVDHPHHRGVFCAWIRAEASRNGDWWGWGQRAPKDGRVIVNRSARVVGGTIEAVNVWKAENDEVMLEHVRIRPSSARGHTIVDYEYHFAPATSRPVVIQQEPFGGFCYRAKPRGEIIISDASGPLDTPNADPDVPARNWPARPWYDFSTKSADGKIVGGAVIEHPKNPKGTWHIVRFAHMLNPCICRDGPVTIGAKGLTLRYRVAAHDGPADAAALNALHADFAKT